MVNVPTRRHPPRAWSRRPGRRLRLVSALAALVLLAGPGEAAEVYKWVDAEGNVIYSQRPPPGGQAETITTPESPVSEEAARARLERLTGRGEEERREREQLARQAGEDEAAAKRREENCAVARRNLEILQNSARVQSTGEDGNLSYLSEEAKQRKLTETQAQIAEFCR